MDDALYREIILEHWKSPQNYGLVKEANIDISEFNPLCGDRIRITAKIKKNKITEVMFTSEGCVISKASASIFTQAVKGMTLENFKKFTPEKFLKTLEIKLSPARIKCALLGYSTLRKATIGS